MKSTLRKHKILHIPKSRTNKNYYAILKNKDTGSTKVIDTTAPYRNDAEIYFIEYAIKNHYDIEFIGLCQK